MKNRASHMEEQRRHGGEARTGTTLRSWSPATLLALPARGRRPCVLFARAASALLLLLPGPLPSSSPSGPSTSLPPGHSLPPPSAAAPPLSAVAVRCRSCPLPLPLAELGLAGTEHGSRKRKERIG